MAEEGMLFTDFYVTSGVCTPSRASLMTGCYAQRVDMHKSDKGFEIVEQVGSPAVKLLYDIYHQQITEGNLIATITSHIELIGHFHAADVPGRHELGTGEINYANVLAAIDEAGYEGFIGLEYAPTVATAESLQAVLAMREEINS